MRNLAVTHYVGILDGAKDVWGVRIPDIPGCYGGGGTPEAALADAISTLREFATHQATKGITLDRPRKVQEVIRDEAAEFDAAAGEAIVLVPLLLDQARPVKANISLDAGPLEAIDAEAQRRGLTRSAFLTSAAIDKIEASTRETPASPVRKRQPRAHRGGNAGKARAQLPTDVRAPAHRTCRRPSSRRPAGPA